MNPASNDKPLLRLAARSRKGANKLREAAAAMPEWSGLWSVARRRMEVPFAPGAIGPWLLVEPADAEPRAKERHSRWVHACADADFIVFSD